MNIFQNVRVILTESLSSPMKDSFITEVNGKPILLREGGNYQGADLRGANLTGARLERVNLEGADLTGAILENALLRGANLKHTKLTDAIVSGADFTGAILSSSDNTLEGVKATFPPLGVTISVGEDNGN